VSVPILAVDSILIKAINPDKGDSILKKEDIESILWQIP